MNTVRSNRRRLLEKRLRRIRRKRARISGTPERPRVAVHRSHRHFHAQAIDDTTGRTLVAASTDMKELRDRLKHGGGVDAAVQVAALLAEKAKEKGIEKIVLDHRWYRYHGRVKAFADALRKAGIKF